MSADDDHAYGEGNVPSHLDKRTVRLLSPDDELIARKEIYEFLNKAEVVSHVQAGISSYDLSQQARAKLIPLIEYYVETRANKIVNSKLLALKESIEAEKQSPDNLDPKEKINRVEYAEWTLGYNHALSIVTALIDGVIGGENGDSK